MAEFDPRQLLLPRLLGLLDDAGNAALDESLARNSELAELYAQLAAESADTHDLGHIPSAWIARWPRTLQTVSGLERMALRVHLRDCAECRRDVELLGHEATVPFDQLREPDARQAALLDDKRSSPHSPARDVRATRAPRHRRFSFSQVWAGTATAIAAALALVLVGLPPSEQNEVLTHASPLLTRSHDPSAELIVPTGQSDFGLVLTADRLGVSPGEPVTLVLLDADSSEISRLAMQGPEVTAEPFFTVWRCGEKMDEGLYYLTIAVPAGETAIRLPFRFQRR